MTGPVHRFQELLSTHRLIAGTLIVDRKIGLTAPAVQQQLRVDHPEFGVLFADVSVQDRASVPVVELLQPKVEAEVAFVLGTDLSSGPLDEARIRASPRPRSARWRSWTAGSPTGTSPSATPSSLPGADA